MKSFLLTTISFFIVIFHVQSQSIWEVEDHTINQLGLMPSFSQLSFVPGYGSQFEYTINGNQIQIDFENKLSPDNWSDFSFLTIDWTGNTGNPFKYSAPNVSQPYDTVVGYSVDMTQTASQLVSFQIQTSQTIQLMGRVIDINGKYANFDTPILIVDQTSGGVDTTNESKWQTVTFDWVGLDMSDMYSSEWWGIANQTSFSIANPLNTSRIVGFSFMVDPGSYGTMGDLKSIFIRNIIIGDTTPVKAFTEIEDINLSLEHTSYEIDLADYVENFTAQQYLTGIKSGNKITLETEASKVKINLKDSCTSYTNVITLQVFDGTKYYMQDVNVNFTAHTLVPPSIGVVTVDTLGKNILIAWERNNVNYLSHYTMYREGLTNQFESIGTIPFDSISVFVDENADVNKRAYRYKMTATDVCNNESDYSLPHKSIHLQRVFSNNSLLLNWTVYEGAEVLGYRLLEGNTYSDMQSIDEFSADQISYTVTNAGDKKYRVETIMKNVVTPSILKAESGPFSLALSNIAESESATKLPKTSSNIQIKTQVLDGVLSYSLSNTSSEVCEVQIISVLGTTIVSQDKTGSFKLVPGLYTILVVNGNKSAIKKVLVN